MARKVEEKAIDGVTYEVTQLGAIQARRVSLLLFRAIGPAMGDVVSGNLLENGAKLFLNLSGSGKSVAEAVKSSGEVDELLGVVGAALAKGFGSVARHVTEEDLTALCDAFEGTTNLVHKSTGGASVRVPLKGQFDDHFAGRLVAMYQWLAFCVGVNFGNFFDWSKKGSGSSPNEKPPQSEATK